MNDFPRLFELLARHQVDFIVIGGVAAIAHGATRLTQDFDIVYDREPDNQRRLAAALIEIGARPRGFPAELPFVLDLKHARGST